MNDAAFSNRLAKAEVAKGAFSVLGSTKLGFFEPVGEFGNPVVSTRGGGGG